MQVCDTYLSGGAAAVEDEYGITLSSEQELKCQAKKFVSGIIRTGAQEDDRVMEIFGARLHACMHVIPSSTHEVSSPTRELCCARVCALAGVGMPASAKSQLGPLAPVVPRPADKLRLVG